jgi:hypothetical protein
VTSGFTSHPEDGVLWNSIALKNAITLAGFKLATFGSSGKHTNHYTTKATLYPCKPLYVRLDGLQSVYMWQKRGKGKTQLSSEQRVTYFTE